MSLDLKWVRVMADYSSDGVWEYEGGMMLRDELPISAELAERHEQWCEKYEASTNYLGNGESGYNNDFDLAAFSAEGLEIAKAIKRELPEWTVFYFDEAKCLYTEGLYTGKQPRTEFEYEITLD